MVFFNLFSNAIKYAFDDPGQFEVRIDAEYLAGEFRIHFSDYGPGIEEAYAKSVFEHGMRGPTALSKIVKGMGLGLWVVRRVVEAHEGHVEVTNYHQPTTITISLPEARRSSAPAKIKGR
jgi:signal transduction histidine kinase